MRTDRTNTNSQVTQALDRFEAAWQSDNPPEIADFLPQQADAAARRELLAQLVMIDLELRWRQAAGQATSAGLSPTAVVNQGIPPRPLLEAYVARYPELGSLEKLSEELIAWEFHMRWQWGDKPAVEAYVARFGQGRKSLAAKLEQDLHEQQISRASHALQLTSEQFGKAVMASGLMTAAELKALWAELPAGERPKNGEAFARLLVARKLLNDFQADELISGRATPLVLNEYVLMAKIGAGGMGQVFRAEHRKLKRPAAIKLLPSAMVTDPDAIKRFQREVEAAAKLSHPNIVQTHDADECRGVHYLAMEYVEGRDLAGVLAAEGPLAIDRALDYITQAARGLAYAHSKGIVHRDIKPANLLLSVVGSPSSVVERHFSHGQRTTDHGQIKILDMGLARIDDPAMAAAREGLTHSGQIMGTVDYMAPEQAFDTHTADARADIYSLGCTLYRLLTGANMYQGETALQKLMAHQQKPIPSIRASRDDAPAELDALFQRMVAKQPEDRQQAMVEVIEDLTACAAIVAPQIRARVEAGSALTAAHVGGSSTHKNSRTVQLGDPQRSGDQDTLNPSSIDNTSRALRRLTKIKPTWLKRKVIIVSGLGAAGLLLVIGIIAKFLLPSPLVARGELSRTGEGSGVRGNSNSSSSTLTNAADAPPLAVAPFDAKQARAHQEAWAKHVGIDVETTNSIGMKMTLIPPGEFMMGSTDEQVESALKVAEEIKANQENKGRIRDTERPQHRVAITKPFLMGTMEVTIGQFKKFATAKNYKTEFEQEAERAAATPGNAAPATPVQTWLNPGYAVNDELPVTFVSWNDAVAFCLWLSEQEKLEPPYEGTVGKWTTPTGQGYHLPTEAQWEYACRAGTTTQYSFGDSHRELPAYAWTGGGSPHEVGTRAPNNFGVHDMHGNVWERCQDWYEVKWYLNSPTNDPTGPYSGVTRVIRGGSWTPGVSTCRSAYRNSYTSSPWMINIGFRCVREFGSSPSTASSTPVRGGTAADNSTQNSADGERSVPATLPQSPGSAPPPAVAPFDAKQARAHQEAWAEHLGTKVQTENSIGMKLTLIPPGEFMMGSTDEQVDAALKVAEETRGDQATIDRIRTAERPQHRVVITKPFWLGMMEVTIGQYKKFAAATGYKTEAEQAAIAAQEAATQTPPLAEPPKPVQTYLSPSYTVTDESPAMLITWNDAVAFCLWLSAEEKVDKPYEGIVGKSTRTTGKGYHMPSEAQWEYACRAGTTTDYSFGDDMKLLSQYAVFGGIAQQVGAQQVGTKLPNNFGLHDVHGNVREWCDDWFDANYYGSSPVEDPRGPGLGSHLVLRGGGWHYSPPSHCRSASRYGSAPGSRNLNHGFRVVREIDVQLDSLAR